MAVGFIVWNLIVFLIYGIDKLKAIRSGWRISEKFLLGIAFCMGGVGAFLGMRLFGHKTRKTKFIILIPVSMIFNGAVCWLYIKMGL